MNLINFKNEINDLKLTCNDLFKVNKINDKKQKEITNICNKTLEILNTAKNDLKKLDKSDPTINQYEGLIFNCQEIIFNCEKFVNLFHQSLNIHQTSHQKQEVSISKIPTQFHVKQHFSLYQFIKLAENLIPDFIDKYIGKAYGYLFNGYGRNLVLREYQKKIDQLEKKQSNLSQKMKENQEQIEMLRGLGNTYMGEDIVTDSLSMGMSTATSFSISDQIQKLENVNKTLETELTSTEKLMNELTPPLNKKIAKILDNINKGRETRQLLEQIGGEPIVITTADEVKLNGTFIHRNAFLNELKEQGGKFVTITRTFQDETVNQLKGIAFQKSAVDRKDHIINILTEKLHGITDFNEKKDIFGAGWSRIDDPKEDMVFIFPDRCLLDWIHDEVAEGAIIDTQSSLWESFKGLFSHQPRFPGINPDFGEFKTEKAYSEIDLEKESEGGVVILSSGNAGVYEMHKSETMSFLFNGMSVMLFNFRGYGESEGKPSTYGLHADMNAVYEFVKAYTGLEDKKILFAALCMSGGPAAYVAALHPEVNILLNQTYSSFSELFRDQAIQFVQNKVEEMEANDDWKAKYLHFSLETLSPLIKAGAAAVAPGFDVANHLKKNRGHKAIFYVHDDNLMPVKYVENNIKAVADAGELEHLTVFSSPGKHSENWVNVKATPLGFEMDRITVKKNREIRPLEDKMKDLNKELQKLSSEGKPYTSIENEINQLKKQIERITDNYASKIEKLKNSGLSDSRYTMIARNEIEHFLYKANLADPIIKPLA